MGPKAKVGAKKAAKPKKIVAKGSISQPQGSNALPEEQQNAKDPRDDDQFAGASLQEIQNKEYPSYEEQLVDALQDSAQREDQFPGPSQQKQVALQENKQDAKDPQDDDKFAGSNEKLLVDASHGSAQRKQQIPGPLQEKQNANNPRIENPFVEAVKSAESAKPGKQVTPFPDNVDGSVEQDTQIDSQIPRNASDIPDKGHEPRYFHPNLKRIGSKIPTITGMDISEDENKVLYPPLGNGSAGSGDWTQRTDQQDTTYASEQTSLHVGADGEEVFGEVNEGYHTPQKQISHRVGSAGHCKGESAPLQFLQTPLNVDEDYVYISDDIDGDGNDINSNIPGVDLDGRRIMKRNTTVTCDEDFYCEEITQIYLTMRQSMGDLSPGVHGTPVFGELTKKSNATLLSMLRHHCNFSSKSRFLDIGSGTGKMVQHAARFALLSCGIEVVEDRYQVPTLVYILMLTH